MSTHKQVSLCSMELTLRKVYLLFRIAATHRGLARAFRHFLTPDVGEPAFSQYTPEGWLGA